MCLPALAILVPQVLVGVGSRVCGPCVCACECGCAFPIPRLCVQSCVCFGIFMCVCGHVSLCVPACPEGVSPWLCPGLHAVPEPAAVKMQRKVLGDSWGC